MTTEMTALDVLMQAAPKEELLRLVDEAIKRLDAEITERQERKNVLVSFPGLHIVKDEEAKKRRGRPPKNQEPADGLVEMGQFKKSVIDSAEHLWKGEPLTTSNILRYMARSGKYKEGQKIRPKLGIALVMRKAEGWTRKDGAFVKAIAKTEKAEEAAA